MKMKKFAGLLFVMLVVASSVFAQKADDSKDALAVVNKLWAEMAAANPAGIVALHNPGAQLVAVIKNKEGKSVVRNLTADDFSKNFAVKKELKEDMYAPEVRVDGDVALVWGRYVFFVEGKVSHCGLNAFHLVRTDGGWKIGGIASTIDPGACTEAEKARKMTPDAPTAKPN
jgi:hypothetical protein